MLPYNESFSVKIIAETGKAEFDLIIPIQLGYLRLTFSFTIIESVAN